MHVLLTAAGSVSIILRTTLLISSTLILQKYIYSAKNPLSLHSKCKSASIFRRRLHLSRI